MFQNHQKHQRCGDQMGVVVRNSHYQMECLANVTQMQIPMRKARVALPLAIVEILLTIATVIHAKTSEVYIEISPLTVTPSARGKSVTVTECHTKQVWPPNTDAIFLPIFSGSLTMQGTLVTLVD